MADHTMAPSVLLVEIEAVLVEWASGVEPDPRGGRDRPRILPAAIVWLGLTIGNLRGATSHVAI